ncbi:hypothetical protein H6F87_29075 [Cyanobacteria bacterium FACHB-502]|nr:hypothetical protein [Cyanobacteria bacterium FACHB-502]
MQLTIKFQSARSYLASWQSRIIARYELLKTKSEARLKSVYLGAKSMPEAQTIAKTISNLFQVRVEIRPAQRCATAFEVVVRNIKVAVMAAIEKFVLALITAAEMPTAPAPKPIAPIKPVAPMNVVPLVHRPDLPGRSFRRTSDGKLLNLA